MLNVWRFRYARIAIKVGFWAVMLCLFLWPGAANASIVVGFQGTAACDVSYNSACTGTTVHVDAQYDTSPLGGYWFFEAFGASDDVFDSINPGSGVQDLGNFYGNSNTLFFESQGSPNSGVYGELYLSFATGQTYGSVLTSYPSGFWLLSGQNAEYFEFTSGITAVPSTLPEPGTLLLLGSGLVGLGFMARKFGCA